jgi:predicted peptidase
MFDVRSYNGLQYLISYPENYTAGKKYPVIIMLHGAGSRGTNFYTLRGNDYFTVTEQFENFPFVTVVPQCHENTWFDLFETLKGFVAEISNAEFCDESRIYATGQSMGGYALWQLAMSMPEYFAAIAPICGGGMYWNAQRLKNVPVWAFHGELDEVVFVEESIKMVDAVNKAGGNARLTIFPDCRHESWIPAYSDYSLFEWLLSHTK